MDKRPLGNTGLNVSRIGFGCAPAAFLKQDQDAAAKMIEQLLDAGMNLLDTATAYPGSHEFIGEYLSGRRDDYVLVSKCGNVNKGIAGALWSAENIRAATEKALQTMRTDVLDVMLLHSCSLDVLQKGEAIGELARLRDEGKIRHAGYSGDNEALAYAAEQPDITVIETSVNFVDQTNIDNGLAKAKANGVGSLAKRPIANACWKDLEKQPGMYQNYAKTYTQRLAAMGFTPADIGMSEDDWAELALRFTLNAGPDVLLIGTTNPDNASANLEAVKKGPLSAEAYQTIRQKFAAAADGWTGQT